MDYRGKILDFLSGDLNKQERLAFESALLADNQLQEELRLQQEVLYALKQGDDDVLAFRKQVEGIGQEFLKSKKTNGSVRRINPITWASAAAVAVVIGLSITFGWFSSGQQGVDYLYASYYQPYGVEMTVRGESQRERAFEKAIRFYNHGNIGDAMAAFQALEIQNPEVAGFYQGLCYMELGQFNTAIETFNEVKEEAVFYADHINWYLALAYLKQDDVVAAKDVLATLSNNSGTYQDKATVLLKALN
jgi:tetratricopeptide (TPR) repeat protein